MKALKKYTNIQTFSSFIAILADILLIYWVKREKAFFYILQGICILLFLLASIDDLSSLELI